MKKNPLGPSRPPRQKTRPFDFDAPRIKDFTKKEYQQQKRAIEKILQEFGNPGEPQDPAKSQPAKRVVIGAAAPRKTFFSQFSEPSRAKPAAPLAVLPPGDELANQSIDEQWFARKEKAGPETEESYRGDEPTPGTPLLSPALFDSDEEPDILPHLKIIATPPISRVRRTSASSSISAEFNETDIQELSKLSRDSL